MSIISEFEDRIAGAVEGLFAGAFRSPVQPAEMARALARAMDDGRSVGVSKVYVPTSFAVVLSDEDAEKLGDFAPTLAGELATFLVSHAGERGYELITRPAIEFAVHDDLKLGRFRVSARMAAAPAGSSHSPSPSAPAGSASGDRSFEGRGSAAGSAGDSDVVAHAVVTISDRGEDVPLTGDRVEIGRLDECGVRLSDVNVSRRHAAFVREGDGWAIEDLGSTNGTLLNGERVPHARLRDGDVVGVGASRLVYHGGRG